NGQQAILVLIEPRKDALDKARLREIGPNLRLELGVGDEDRRNKFSCARNRRGGYSQWRYRRAASNRADLTSFIDAVLAVRAFLQRAQVEVPLRFVARRALRDREIERETQRIGHLRRRVMLGAAWNHGHVDVE